ncbi:hypothetical protein AX774_g5548 [Zancudomyces culisetae]|uniref:Velvet domain-containing protein n=1 Tax=Zancudomyces culisetae TaxID=1213189 RepID=A0A1R1PJ59_ZANCU|nr:hypothetical protein AX774_g5548 [Zancudomyces culisetae]|eukprot:OMH81011.1 hypothetical protein AX774_g5548 [Zancudomyces culisetae]
MIKNLVGNTVTTSLNLHDLDGNVGIYFIFNDLSIRKDGIFRLKFLFFDLGREGRINSSFTEVRAEVFSEPFYVFTARNFPGMIGKPNYITSCTYTIYHM